MASCTWHIKCVWSLCSCSSFRPCIQWMWHFVELSWEREEVSLANNESFSRCKGRFFFGLSMKRGTMWIVCQEAAALWCNSAYKRFFSRAHQKRSISRRSCLGSAWFMYSTGTCTKSWGWMKERINDSWKPKWTSLTAVASSCQEILKCGGENTAVLVTVDATVLAFLVRVVV